MGAGYNTTHTKFIRPGVYNRYKCFGGREADGFSVVPLSSLVEVMCVQKGWLLGRERRTVYYCFHLPHFTAAAPLS